MSYDKYKNHERGVVLLSCLIFLIILLAFMRFMIGNAKMSELKAGADFDQMKAQEMANLTMRSAEQEISRVDEKGKSLVDKNLSVTGNKGKVLELAAAYWTGKLPDKDGKKISFGKGIYDGDKNPCTDQKCSNHVKDWKAATCGTNVLCPTTGGGKYIIERFTGNGAKLAMGKADEKVVILRVTGIGYSDENNVDASQTMLQNTYILSSKK
ncbi:pilus assembly PilX family protein [Suttonella ornithocola]|uniref:Tfp pilus assembly protein PilX n=1 Tax=Suttonella ornithocola TaxID=279832 RepID=A0A380MTJ0_9GAMM|nr:hypothetical protein [Suttonella ornithocola]SUO94657.1 Tfp pilus assembly protein PilX [Suttonella ornithocola]